jgi:uncharacterized protein (TIGR02246 family)
MKNVLFMTAQDAETAFYEALEKADLDAMMAVWADDDDIVCVHPGGMRLAGVEQVREAWRQIFAGGSALRVRLRHLRSSGGMTVAVHSVYEQIAVIGESQARHPVVATNIYMRTEQGWRMFAHHASPAPASPDAETKRRKVLH